MIKAIYKKLIPEKSRLKLRLSLQKLTFPFYVGTNFYCNCCGKSFRKFLPKGNIIRQNAKCPYCSSLERVRLLDLYLDQELNVYKKKDIKVLHFAPEAILFKKFSSQQIEYIDCDINPAYARYIVDITSIPYPDDYFNLIICSHVLGHIPDEVKAIHELKRVLKDDGIALIMTLLNLKEEKTFEDPKINSAQDRLKYYGEPDLCRLHGNDFAARMQSQGFKVERIDYRKQVPEEVVVKNSLGNGEREIIFKCTK